MAITKDRSAAVECKVALRWGCGRLCRSEWAEPRAADVAKVTPRPGVDLAAEVARNAAPKSAVATSVATAEKIAEASAVIADNI